MNCLIKKRPYNTDKSHILSGKKTINMFLILLIYHLINVFSDFPGAYCRKYTVLINKIIFCTLNIRTLYNNYFKELFLAT